MGKVGPYRCVDLSGCSWRKRRGIQKEVRCLGLYVVPEGDGWWAAGAFVLAKAELVLVLFRSRTCRLKHFVRAMRAGALPPGDNVSRRGRGATEWSGSWVDGANRRSADSAGGCWSVTGRLCCTFSGALLVLLQFFQKDGHGRPPSLPADEGLRINLFLKSTFLFVHLRCLVQHVSDHG